jgi:hypothetical protein
MILWKESLSSDGPNLDHEFMIRNFKAPAEKIEQ